MPFIASNLFLISRTNSKELMNSNDVQVNHHHHNQCKFIRLSTTRWRIDEKNIKRVELYGEFTFINLFSSHRISIFKTQEGDEINTNKNVYVSLINWFKSRKSAITLGRQSSTFLAFF